MKTNLLCLFLQPLLRKKAGRCRQGLLQPFNENPLSLISPAIFQEVAMSKFGLKKTTVHDRAADEQVAHVHVPGRAYNVADPVTKLIHTIGGGFFNEPKYYDSNRSFAAFYAELL